MSNRSISRKAQATLIRQQADTDAMDAAAKPYILDPDFKIVGSYRIALSNWAFDCDDVDHGRIMERFNADVGLSDNIKETIQEWQAWCSEIMDAIEKRDRAQASLNKMAASSTRGTAGNHFGQTFLVIDRDDAQEDIDRLKDGPEIGGEGVELDDPNYLPF